METRFWKDLRGNIRHRLKNDHEHGVKVWRYHDYISDLPMITKRSILMSTLRKVHKMASDDDELAVSAMDKLRELGYPKGVRKYMCAIMARDYSNLTWRKVREMQ